MSAAWIALGSNLGDREGILLRAVSLLELQGVRPVRLSRFYETAPEGGRDEPPYLNAVLQAETELDPAALLKLLLEVEASLGRSRRAGPRTCDLDLLSLDDLVLEDPQLRLPHPRLHRRGFVLVPLCELDVHWRHPSLLRTAGELLADLPPEPGSIRPHRPERRATLQGSLHAGP